MTDYDAAAHISEEVHRAAIAAPVAIFVAVIGTGALGWVLNVVLVLCSPDIATLPGASGSAFLEVSCACGAVLSIYVLTWGGPTDSIRPRGSHRRPHHLAIRLPRRILHRSNSYPSMLSNILRIQS
jgi:amino acid transporter